MMTMVTTMMMMMVEDGVDLSRVGEGSPVESSCLLGDLLPAAGFGFSKLGLGKLGEVESLGKEEAAPLVGDLQRFFLNGQGGGIW